MKKISTVKAGDQAPDFTLEGVDGKWHSLTDFRGHKVVLYFYPKDMTPGCTRQACNLNENYGRLQQAGYKVLGISPDTVEKHQRFAKKYGLSFLLLSDPDGTIARKYGVWGKKKFMGKEYEGIIRTTFIISEEGTVIRVIEEVKVEDHANQILNS